MWEQGEDQGLPGTAARPRVRVRRQLADDVAAVSRVRARSWRSAYTGVVPTATLDDLEPTPDSIARAQEHFGQLGKNVYALVAELDREIVGFVRAGPDRDAGPPASEIWAIYVDPQHWRGGIGHSLMAAAVRTLSESGMHPISLWVLDDNARARRFYERWGFVETGERRFINLGRPLPEVRYALAR